MSYKNNKKERDNIPFDVLRVEGDPETIKSAKRVLQIIELLKEKRRPLLTTEIALELKLPLSSTAALLKCLVSLGYLHFGKMDRKYRASLRINLLSDGYQRGGLATLMLTDERWLGLSAQA